MNICVIGVGNIGMRYVQGISKTIPEAQLYLVDTQARLDELAKLELANVTLQTSIDDIDDAIDLFAVATSCEPRFEIYQRCLERQPSYIILDKYLFKSREEFEASLHLESVPTFVNQWMYGSNTFHPLFKSPAQSVELTGSNWGLACNSVHWIDIFKRHMSIDSLVISGDTRVSNVFASKRPGYEEIYGELVFEDTASDKTFKLIDHGDPSLAGRQEITVDGKRFVFDFKRVLDGEQIVSHFPYFSDLIGGITAQILETGKSTLPRLAESVSQHLLVEGVLEALDRRPNIT